MEIQEREYVYIQSYKHDGSLHRTWAKGYVIEANERRIVAVTNKTLVSESDGRKWVTREPAPDRASDRGDFEGTSVFREGFYDDTAGVSGVRGKCACGNRGLT